MSKTSHARKVSTYPMNGALFTYHASTCTVYMQARCHLLTNFLAPYNSAISTFHNSRQYKCREGTFASIQILLQVIKFCDTLHQHVNQDRVPHPPFEMLGAVPPPAANITAVIFHGHTSRIRILEENFKLQ